MTGLIGTISYGVCCAAYLVLTALLLASWRGRMQGALLVFAAAVSALWAGSIAWEGEDAISGRAVQVLEFLRTAAWLTFFVSLLAHTRSAYPIKPILAVAAVCCLVVGSAIYFSSDAGELITRGIAPLVLALAGMVLQEQLYRNADVQHRWGIKFLCFGVGGLFAYDFYLYSDAALFRRVDLDIWNARGIVNALIVPMIAVSAARNPGWDLKIAVSRRLVFQSAVIVCAAIYLLLIATAGYVARFFGGSWGAALQTALLFSGLIALLALLFSGGLRSRLRVFLSKHFFSYRYDYREEWQNFTRALSEGEPGVRFRERSIEAMARLVESPAGALWLRNEHAVFVRAAHWNLSAAAGEERASSAFCRFLQSTHWVVDVDEVHARPQNYQNLRLPDWLQALPQAWLIAPLMLHETLQGFAVLARPLSPITINWEVNDLLRTAGAQAASYLAQLEAAKALMVARRFESFNRVSAFLVHDLKNVAAQLSLLAVNSKEHRDNPEFQNDMTATLENSAQKIKRLLEQLRGRAASLAEPSQIRLAELLRAVIAEKAGCLPVPRVEIADGNLTVSGEAERLHRVIGHLVQNAIEATPEHGAITVKLMREMNCAIIEIADTGRGMSERFVREDLFKPFSSSKPAGMGIGAYECRQYVLELDGRIEVSSRENAGSIFRVILPLTPASSRLELE